MNRKERRKMGLRVPHVNGSPLCPVMMLVETRDERGRPLQARIVYDAETLTGKPSADMLLLWGPPAK